MKQRNLIIDMLRGVAIFGMIIIHTTAYYLNNSVISSVWNFTEFVVPVFVFCSAYLFFLKYQHTYVDVIRYCKNRFFRLLIPYYIFLLFFIPSMFIINRHEVTIWYVIQSILTVGGVDISWLVLLFLCLTVLLPIISNLQKRPLFFWVYFILSLLFSCIQLVHPFPIPYKYIMWLPWSIVLYFTLYYLKNETKKRKLILISLVLIVIFLCSYLLQIMLHHNLLMINNKYPPNIMYLSFSLLVMMVLIYLIGYIKKINILISIIGFFSRYSYEIFFIHYFFLIIYATFLNRLHVAWITYFLTVLISTILVQMGLILLKKRFLKSARVFV